MSNKEPVIREKFEQCLVDGLTGKIIVAKDGTPVTDPDSGEILRDPPDASFLSVVRGYLKDLLEPGNKDKTLNPGKSKGMLAQFEKKLPFGSRAN